MAKRLIRCDTGFKTGKIVKPEIKPVEKGDMIGLPKPKYRAN